ncbi:MAG: hypothetical protein J6K38_02745 [Alistipes sp.]|nr:hypothetical protein [Alistipes sp.]
MGTMIIGIICLLGVGVYVFGHAGDNIHNIKEQTGVKCPQCKSTHVGMTDYYNIDDGLIGNRLFKEYECQECGKRFSIPAD